MLAAAAALAACAGRGEDDMGAAPDRGEDTAVTTGIDTTQLDTTGTGGAVQTPEPAVPDRATPAPEYPATPEPTADTTINEPGYPEGQDPGAAGGYDTTAVPGVDTTSTGVPPADPGLPADTGTGVPPADPGMSGDTTVTPDTGTANPDSGWQGDAGAEAVPPTDSAVSQ